MSTRSFAQCRATKEGKYSETARVVRYDQFESRSARLGVFDGILCNSIRTLTVANWLLNIKCDWERTPQVRDILGRN